MVEIIRHSVKPLPDVLIKRSFPALVQCILRSEDYTVIQVSLLFAMFVILIQPRGTLSRNLQISLFARIWSMDVGNGGGHFGHVPPKILQ